ncbi:DNA repair protein RadC, partial [Streptococcus pyogenes]
MGPLDMGYLTYNPNHVNLQGVDHFVSIYDFKVEEVYLHDPAGYPCVHMDFKEFLQAWRADAIDYKRGSYSMWG